MKKIDVWKRKLLKEKRKQQQIMWDALSKTHKGPASLSAEFDLSEISMVEQPLIDELAKQFRDQIDKEILESFQVPEQYIK